MQPPLEPPTLGDGAGIGPRLCGDDPDHGSDDDRRRERTHARHNGFTRAYVAGHGDQDDEVPAAEVIKAGDPAGYEERDLIEACNKIKHLVGSRKDGMKGGWVWFLTVHSDNDPLK